MSAIHDAIFGIVIGLSLSVWPGDGLSRAVRGAVRGGLAGGLAAGVGGVAANLLAALLIGTVVLLAPVTGNHDSAGAMVVGLLSGTALVVLGWLLMEDRTAGAVHRERAGDHVRVWAKNPFLDRFFASVLSPRWHVLWWVAGTGMLLVIARDGWRGLAAFAVGLGLSGLLVRTILAVRLAAPGREWAVSDRTFRIVTALAGLGIVGLGFFVAYDATVRISLDESLKRIVETVFG